MNGYVVIKSNDLSRAIATSMITRQPVDFDMKDGGFNEKIHLDKAIFIEYEFTLGDGAAHGLAQMTKSSISAPDSSLITLTSGNVLIEGVINFTIAYGELDGEPICTVQSDMVGG